MMDPGANFFPKGFHPIRPLLVAPNPDSPRLIFSDPTSRTLSNVKYHIIDFGQSVMFDNHNKRHKITGSVGHHLNIPDFADEDEPYDPFQLDIRALGETFNKGPMQVCDMLSSPIRSTHNSCPTLRTILGSRS